MGYHEESTGAAEPGVPPGDPAHRATLLLLGVLLLAAALFVGLVVYASPGLRGSDQYWYFEDVSTLVSGAPAQTHETYPFSLLDPDSPFAQERPFIHNAPVLYVWAAAARLTGDAHQGIQLVNIACGLLAALFVFLAARRLAPEKTAACAAAALLLLPVSFWITSQDLAEPSSMMLVAMALWVVVQFPDRFGAYAAAQVSIAIAASGRIWVLPLLLILPIGLAVVDTERLLSRRLARAAAALFVGIAVYIPISQVFASYGPPLNPASLVALYEGPNNMSHWFTAGRAPQAGMTSFVSGVVPNIREAIVRQLGFSAPLDPGWLASQIPVNILILMTIWGLSRRTIDRTKRFILIVSLGGILAYLGMSVLFQSQPRYVVPVLPALALGGVAAASTFASWKPTRRVRVALLLAVAMVLLLFAAADFGFATYFRRDAASDETRRMEAAELVSGVLPPDARVVLDTDFSSRWPMDYALYPRELLSLDTNIEFDTDQYAEMLVLFEPDYLVVDETSRLPEMFDVRLIASDEESWIYELVGENPGPDS